MHYYCIFCVVYWTPFKTNAYIQITVWGDGWPFTTAVGHMTNNVQFEFPFVIYSVHKWKWPHTAAIVLQLQVSRRFLLFAMSRISFCILYYWNLHALQQSPPLLLCFIVHAVQWQLRKRLVEKIWSQLEANENLQSTVTTVGAHAINEVSCRYRYV